MSLNLKGSRWVLCGLLIGVFATLAFTQTGTSKRFINLPGRNTQAPFSDGVLSGDTLYLAGRLGRDPKTGQIPADIEVEVRNLLDGIKAVLAEGKMTMDDLVYVQIYCPDVSLFDKFNGIYRSYFSRDFPARAFIGSGPLLFGAHFELQAIARK